MLLFLLFTAIAAGLFYELYWKRRNYPPGPLPVPLIGNIIPMLRDGPGLNSLKGWKEQYGAVYTYWIGAQAIVTVNDWDTIKEAFIKEGDAYADRHHFGQLNELFRDGNYGVIDASGQVWLEQRRFALHTLRDFGLGKAAMQDRVLAEASHMLQMFEDNAKCGAFKISDLIDRTVGSVINSTIFGYRFDETNVSEFFELRDLLNKQTRAFSDPLTMVAFSVPILCKIPFFGRRLQVFRDVKDAVFAFFAKQIKNHEADIDFDSEGSSDFCEAYLKEMRAREGEEDTTFHRKQLENVCFDLWLAGLETTASTLAWAVVHLIHNPDVQSRAHDELDRVIGSSRLVDLEDRSRLPYINAIINETQRCANIIPQNLLRKTGREVVVAGHRIQKGTPICPQISLMLYDEKLFPNPSRFNPDNFVDAAGNPRKIEQFMPFSVGKRACPGEGLARVELYLFLANLLNRFEILPEEPNKLPSTRQALFSGTKPEAFQCRLRQRNSA